MSEFVLVSTRKFPEKTTKSFKFKIAGKIHQGFVVREKDKFFVYLNRCRHLPVTLDLEDNAFFTHDKKHLQCHMHGAVYEISTGLCVAGPCQGASLIPLDFEIEGSNIIIPIPEKEIGM